jgi:hypothetical protein
LATFVSATNLVWEFPRSLLTALADTHPKWEILLHSLREEKDCIESLDTYDKITLVEYRALQEKGASQAVPTMFVLTIKPDKKMNLHCTKSRVFV